MQINSTKHEYPVKLSSLPHYTAPSPNKINLKQNKPPRPKEQTTSPMWFQHGIPYQIPLQRLKPSRQDGDTSMPAAWSTYNYDTGKTYIHIAPTEGHRPPRQRHIKSYHTNKNSTRKKHSMASKPRTGVNTHYVLCSPRHHMAYHQQPKTSHHTPHQHPPAESNYLPTNKPHHASGRHRLPKQRHTAR